MGYGASARRVPALGGAVLSDVDIFKVLLIGQTERGVVDEDGYPVLMDEIYSMNDFYPKCGGFNSSYYAAYVAQSFFDELEANNVCEMKVMSWVAADAVQAAYIMLDSTPVKIFDVKAGRKGLADKSAFGNKVGVKVSTVKEISMKLTAEVADSATTCYLDNVDNLEVGNYIEFIEGSDTEVRVITAINTALKKVDFAAITESGGFSVSGTTVYRLDTKLEVAVKDETGNYQKKEEWKFPFTKSNTTGVAGEINDEFTGSDYIYLVVDADNASAPEDQLPADLTSWTALTGGSDGTAAVDANWNTLATTYLESVEFTFLLAPESSSITHNQNMLNFSTDNYKGMFYGQASNGASEAILKNFGASLRGAIKFGMLPSDKWIRVSDPTVINGTIDIPMCGIAAAFWFNVYVGFGESKVAAGNKSEMVLKSSGKLLDSNGLVHDDLSGVGGRMIRNYSVNISRYKRGKGNTINSARTFSTDGGYKYQNQIMQFLLYSRSIVAYLREIEQDRSGARAQEQHRNVVWSYMKKKFDAGHLFVGQKEDGSFTGFSDVCVIVNDFSLNTLARIANGEEEMFLQFIAIPPIEQPILSLASAPVTAVKG